MIHSHLNPETRYNIFDEASNIKKQKTCFCRLLPQIRLGLQIYGNDLERKTVAVMVLNRND